MILWTHGPNNTTSRSEIGNLEKCFTKERTNDKLQEAKNHISALIIPMR